jgi:hypothetical protein
MWVGFDADNKTTAQVKYSKSIDNGVTWSAWINIQPIAGQSSPSMTIDSNNNIHVVCANGYKIQYTKSTDTGSTWSVWTNVAYINSSGAYQSNPSIVIDSNNNIHVAWHGIDSSN